MHFRETTTNKFEIWVDDVRPSPPGYIWCKSVNDLINTIGSLNVVTDNFDFPVTLVDLDHDAGDYAKYGGDYIKFLDYCEERWGKDLPFSLRIHSMNPVGVQNMRAIIEKNNWREVR